MLPKRAAQTLKQTLRKLEEETNQMPAGSTNSLDRDFKRKCREQNLELLIQEAFLRFMASILKGYREYLVPMSKAPTAGSTDPNALFQMDAFLRSRDKAHHKFYNIMMTTQMFIRFIEERSIVSDGYQGLAFFDECSDKVPACDDQSSVNQVRLIDWDSGQNSERAKYIFPPDTLSTTDSDITAKPPLTTSFTLNPALLKRSKAQLSKLVNSPSAPGSPMARRTKYEIKMAQKQARICQLKPGSWAHHLLATCYSLYFLILPSILLQSPDDIADTLKASYDVLSKANKLHITCDEVCYRVMMQLCGIHNLPILAVRLYYLMKRAGIQPNAVTYGFYNRCVLEAQWPSDTGTQSKLRWSRLKNVILAVAQFKRAAIKSDQTDTASDDATTTNPSTNESNYFSVDFFTFDKLRGRLGNLVHQTDRQGITSSVGSLSIGTASSIKAKKNDNKNSQTDLNEANMQSSGGGVIDVAENALAAGTSHDGEEEEEEEQKIEIADDEDDINSDECVAVVVFSDDKMVDDREQQTSPKRLIK